MSMTAASMTVLDLVTEEPAARRARSPARTGRVGRRESLAGQVSRQEPAVGRRRARLVLALERP